MFLEFGCPYMPLPAIQLKQHLVFGTAQPNIRAVGSPRDTTALIPRKTNSNMEVVVINSWRVPCLMPRSTNDAPPVLVIRPPLPATESISHQTPPPQGRYAAFVSKIYPSETVVWMHVSHVFVYVSVCA